MTNLIPSCELSPSETQIIWGEIAHELREQKNAERLVTLWKALDQAMIEEERRRVKMKLEQNKRSETAA